MYIRESRVSCDQVTASEAWLQRFNCKRMTFCWLWWLRPINVATEEVEIRRIEVWGQPGWKFHETPITTSGWAWWYMSVISATKESTNRIAVQAGLVIKWALSKTAIAQMVEQLPLKKKKKVDTVILVSRSEALFIRGRYQDLLSPPSTRGQMCEPSRMVDRADPGYGSCPGWASTWGVLWSAFLLHFAPDFFVLFLFSYRCLFQRESRSDHFFTFY
jgi:hypothetical protein